MSRYRIFSSDLDGTLLGDPALTRLFAEVWSSLPAENRPLLVYNSGRLVEDIRDVAAASGLPPPDFIIGGVGTQVFDHPASSPVGDFDALLSKNWDRDAVERIVGALPGARPQEERYQHAYKSSWHLTDMTPDAISDLEARIRDGGVRAEIVYSSDRDLDILPGAGTKGAALGWLAARLGFRRDTLLVAGDTGNDASMFLLPEVSGILVANARRELVAATEGAQQVYRAARPEAAGVVEGLVHFGVVGDSAAAALALAEANAGG